MNVGTVTRVAVRFFAIWVFLSGASGLAGIAALDMRTLGYGAVVGVTVGGVAIQMVAAFILWRYAHWVAERVTAGTSSAITVSDLSPFLMAQAAVGVVGVFMLSSAIPETLWFMVAFVASRLVGPSPLAGQPAYDAQMGLYAVGGMANGAAVLLRLLLGVFLVFRARAVSGVILTNDTSEIAASRPTRA